MSLALPSEAPAALVNKRELARALKVSLPTVSALLDRYPDFPVEKRGTNGVEWQFSLAAVVAFVRVKREEEARSKAERDEQLAQLVLPLELVSAPAPAAGLSLKDQFDAARLRDMLRKEAVTTGELVQAAAIEDAYATIFAAWSRELHGFVRIIAREQRWPEAILSNVEQRLDALQERLVDEAPDLLNAAQPALLDVRQRAHA